MILSRIRSIYKLSNSLWGGDLDPLALRNVCSFLTHFCPSFGDVISDIARWFFGFSHNFFSQKIQSTSPHTYPKIGIGFSFSPTIACCGVRAIVFETTKK